MQEMSDSTAAERCPQALCLHDADNVAVVLADIGPGPAKILGPACKSSVAVIENINQGHKVALRPIAEGQNIIKYGVAIGVATKPITCGAWVHTHNCRSTIDERSHTLDPHSGAPTDTSYV